MKRDILKTLFAAGRPDLATAYAVAAPPKIKRRKGTERDGEPVPDVVFENEELPDVRLYWYRPGRADESAGLYVDAGPYEFWWHGIDERKAARLVADIVVELMAASDDRDIYRELRLLGGR